MPPCLYVLRLGRLLSLVAVAMCVTAVSAYADTLAGRVLDDQGLVVVNARVKLLARNGGNQRNTVSGADGRYSFPGIPAGNYVIEAEAANSALVFTGEVSVSGEQQLDLTMRVAATQTEVIVTGSTTAQTITETAKAINIVSAEEMNLRGVFQITEALKTVPGLQIQTLEGPGSFTTIQTRGLRAADTAVLIDGLRFQDSGSPQNDATSFLEDLVTTDTDRVEVMRGSGSSLYGSSAMAGVINIISRSGGGPVHGEARGEGGGLGLFRGVAGIGGGANDNRVSYSGSVSYLNIADGVRDRSPYRNTSGQGSVRVGIRQNLAVTGRLWVNTANLTSTESPTFTPAVLANSAPGRVEAIPLPDDQLELFEQKLPFSAGNATYIPNQIDPDGNRKSSFFSGTGSLEHVVSDNTTYRVAYQGVDTRRGYVDGPLGPGSFESSAPATSHLNGRTDTMQARIDRRLGGRQTLTGGYEYLREEYIEYHDRPSNDTRTDQITLAQNSHALYGQDQISLMSGQLQVSLAGRMQFFSLQQPEFVGIANNPYEGNIGTLDTPNAYTGDVSAAYFFSGSETKLRMHGGNSYRAPSTYERFGGGSGTYYGDPRLEPERSVAIDGGIDQWLFDSKLQMSATLFWTEILEMIRFANSLPSGDPFGRFFGYANGGKGHASGVELSAQVSPSRKTRAQVSYTYANSESETATFGTDYFKILGIAPHTFAMSVTQFVSSRFHVTFDLYTKSKYNTTLFGASGRLFEFDGPTKANLAAGYEVPLAGGRGLEIYGKIENLFDQRPYEDGYIGPNRWATAGLRLRY